MFSRFSKNISRFVKAELALAVRARESGDFSTEFRHFENAHVIGQESTYWHITVHALMLGWAIRNRQPKEFFGQTFRILGAATKTAIGLVPQGNTGGANISPFKVMPIKPEHQTVISNAKIGV